MANDPPREFNMTCPVPLDLHTTVQMAHGGGGRLMRNLIESMFLPAFGSFPDGSPPPGKPPHAFASTLNSDDGASFSPINVPTRESASL